MRHLLKEFLRRFCFIKAVWLFTRRTLPEGVRDVFYPLLKAAEAFFLLRLDVSWFTAIKMVQRPHIVMTQTFIAIDRKVIKTKAKMDCKWPFIWRENSLLLLNLKLHFYLFTPEIEGKPLNGLLNQSEISIVWKNLCEQSPFCSCFGWLAKKNLGSKERRSYCKQWSAIFFSPFFLPDQTKASLYSIFPPCSICRKRWLCPAKKPPFSFLLWMLSLSYTRGNLSISNVYAIWFWQPLLESVTDRDYISFIFPP